MIYDLERVSRLADYVRGVLGQEDGLGLYRAYQADLEAVSPHEAFAVFSGLLENGQTAAEILDILDKVINVFHKGLQKYTWTRPPAGSFAAVLRQENAALLERLDRMRTILIAGGANDQRLALLAALRELQAFNAHYLKKENILFPYMEQKAPRFSGLAIMWALHDEARRELKAAIALLADETADAADINVQIGQLFFAIHGLAIKEELILLPAASELFSPAEWAEMSRQSFDYGFPFIEPPARPDHRPAGETLAGQTAGGITGTSAGTSTGRSAGKSAGQATDGSAGIQAGSVENFTESGGGAGGMDNQQAAADVDSSLWLKTETGILNLEQVVLIFNALPVDLSFVDENNKVRFFSRPEERIFPRSPAIIGRDVRNCHPPASVAIVEEIVAAFRAGRQDRASFWIDLHGRKILIQYFALRDAAGTYKGVLEVSQDITGISQLTGERRLLDWS